MTQSLRLYRAVYRDHNQAEQKFDLYARDLAHASNSATYLLDPSDTLVRIFENPDW